MDGSKSFEQDNPEIPLAYHWRCFEAETDLKCTKYDLAREEQTTEPLIFADQPIVTIPSETLRPGINYVFELSVSKGSKKSEDTSVVISTTDSLAPSCMIVSSLDQAFGAPVIVDDTEINIASC